MPFPTVAVTAWSLTSKYGASTLRTQKFLTKQRFTQSAIQRHPTSKRSTSTTSLLVEQFAERVESIDTTTRANDDSKRASTLHSTIQILMSDTGGGHRASAYAIRDALDALYPGQFDCDIVDIYTDYGSMWPYNEYVSIYKYMAANPWMWALLYEFGKSDFGLWFNQFMLELFCTDTFTSCLRRPNNITGCRADMVLSVHPLTQDLPLKILSQIDHQNHVERSNNDGVRRKTPFCTIVTDLGSAHPTWFNPGYVLEAILTSQQL
jgi:Monogalactosyldiacylglycerol (MGDG) synthase